MKILLVEDEPKLNKNIAEGLKNRGYAVDSAFDGEEGQRMALWADYDLIILDIMMPKRNGLEVCSTLRAKGKNMPILMLTAKDTVQDKVTGLDIGADDYLIKPFSFEELTARMRSLLRRPSIAATDVLEFEDLRLDTRSQELTNKGKRIELTLREYALMEYLMRNVGRVLSREDLLEHVWDRNHDSFSNVVDVHLKNLRKKLPTLYAKRIKTVWGKGYQLI